MGALKPTKNGTNHVAAHKSDPVCFSQLRASSEAWIAEDDAIMKGESSSPSFKQGTAHSTTSASTSSSVPPWLSSTVKRQLKGAGNDDTGNDANSVSARSGRKR